MLDKKYLNKELHGLFWENENPSTKVEGFIFISEKYDISVKLYNVLDNKIHGVYKPKLINAHISELGEISLFNIHNDNYMSFSQSNFIDQSCSSKLTGQFEYLVIGKYISKIQSLSFDLIEFSSLELLNWIDEDRFTVEESEDKTIVNLNNFNRSYEITGDDVLSKIVLKHHYFAPKFVGRLLTELEFSCELLALLQFSSSISLERAEDYIKTLKLFFSLILGIDIHFDRIIYVNSSDNSKYKIVSKNFYCDSSRHDNIGFELYQEGISYKDIKDNLSIIFSIWLEKKKIIWRTINLYLNTSFSKNIYIENQFTNYLTALESFHSRLKDAPNVLSRVRTYSNGRPWGRNSKEPALWEILEFLAEKYKKYLAIFFDLSEIDTLLVKGANGVIDAVELRHYFVHFGKNNEEKVKGLKLTEKEFMTKVINAIGFIEFLLKIILLDSIGVDEKVIIEYVEKRIRTGNFYFDRQLLRNIIPDIVNTK